MSEQTWDGQQPAVYPLSLRMDGRLAVVAGGGAVGVRRVAGLRAAGARVLVVAPRLSPALADLAGRGLIEARARPFEPADLDGAWLVHACADRAEVNAAVAAEAERRRIWCVRADDAAAASAWTPAVGRTMGATVAVNAGRDPRRAAALRDACVRAVEAAGPGASGSRRAGGRVSIVGGGPGDPGLITLAGWERLRAAEVVVADRLAPLAALDGLPEGVEVIDAAKIPGGPSMRQEEINRLLVERAHAGRVVVRLKGGDPFVFGRGGEEVAACRAAGVPVEIVPGVSSAVAAPAAAGIPVTHRGVSAGFTVVSGHVPPCDPRNEVDWAALARARTTLVLLMALANLPEIAEALLAGGLPGETPAACVADGWARGQRVVTGSLADIADRVRAAGVANPAVVVIGEVARSGDGGLGRQAPGSDPQAGPAPPGLAPLGTERRGVLPGPASRGPARPAPARRALVLGGARSGKSAAAEAMLAGCGPVDYLATGPAPGDGDGEWDLRVDEHRRRRPTSWRTVETLAVDQELAVGGGAPALVDSLSAWLARVMDECGVWAGAPGAEEAIAARVDALALAWQRSGRHVVAVSDEVGCGVVPASPSGRRYRDELGRLNARIAAACDEVWLCTAGIARRLR